MLRGSITYTRSPETTLKQFRPILKEKMQEVGNEWHSKFFPGHFEPGAAAKYKYRKRSEKYRLKKLRVSGQRKPLVFTGRMKRELLRMARLSGSAKSVSVKMTGPAYSKYHNKLRELTGITNKEANELAHDLDARMEEGLNNIHEREVKHFR